jgi:ABC-type glycerol-3-phosphate transport system permease component
MTSADSSLAPVTRVRRRRPARWPRKVLGYAVLSLLAIIALIPFAWTVSTSLKNIDEVFTFPPQWLPSTLRWQNYTNLWHQLPMGRWIINSFVVVILSVLGKLILASTAAYAFARLRFPGRDWIFYGLLTALMIPWEVTLIPGFILMRQFGWIDTPAALIVPSIADVFGIFLLRQHFLSLPRELEDSARVDGAGHLRTFVSIALPLSKAPLAVVGALGFMGVWNSFLWPLIMINTPEKFTLPVGLQLLNSQHSTDWTTLMAGDVIALIPVVVVYLLAQRYFVEGITVTGVKG